MRGAAAGPGGFSVGELLVVLAVIGLVVAIAIPLVAEQIRMAKIRGAADEYAMALKAVRMIAVSKRAPQAMTVLVHPTNQYSYADTHGDIREVQLPDGVRFTSSTNPITFQLGGLLNVQASTVLEADMTGGVVERWTVTIGIMGMPSVDHVRQ
jgi:type II secretory pathway pseudopilin PulG